VIWPHSLHCRLQRTGIIVLPSELHAELEGVEALSVGLALPGIACRVECSIWRTRAVRRGKVYVDITLRIPKVLRDVTLVPCDVDVELSPVVASPGAKVIHPLSGAARFPANVFDHKSSVYAAVPLVWLRGLEAEGWHDLAVTVVAPGKEPVTFNSVLGQQILLPRHSTSFRDAERVVVELRQLHFERTLRERLFANGVIDWTAVVPDGVILEDKGPNAMLLSTPYSAPQIMRKTSPIAAACWLLGVYQAEGAKEGSRWCSVPQKTPHLLRDVAVTLTTDLGIDAERIELQLSMARDCPRSEEDLRGRYEGVIHLDVKHVTHLDPTAHSNAGEYHAKLSIVDSFNLHEMICTTLADVRQHVEEIEPSAALAFAIGYLDGDAAITMHNDGTPMLSVSGCDAEETAMALRCLERGLRWLRREHYYDLTSHSARRRLSLREAVELACAGAFRYSLARARLLLSIDDLWSRWQSLGGAIDRKHAELAPEIAALKQYVPSLDDAITGVKSVPYPLSEHGEDHVARRQRERLGIVPREVVRSHLAHQRRIREEEAQARPEEQLVSLRGAVVKRIPRDAAKPVIMRYEWLRSMGTASACYGLLSERSRHDEWSFEGHEILGVVCFGRGPGAFGADVCGDEHRDKAVCLERGACVHWAPKNAASFLIRHAVQAAHMDLGWKIYYSYADEEAGEIGTVYQASNWHYIGKGPGCVNEAGDRYRTPAGAIVRSRALNDARLSKADAILAGWEVQRAERKHKYVWFEGSRAERRALLKACRYPFLPYPKRPAPPAP
jgi:hypothetical protein